MAEIDRELLALYNPKVGRCGTKLFPRACAGDMSSRRKRRRASERRLAKISRRSPITIWTIVIIAVVALALKRFQRKV